MADKKTDGADIPELGDHVEDYLAYRVLARASKLAVVPVTLVAIVAGWFGWDLRTDLLEIETTLRDDVLGRAQTRLDSLDDMRRDLEFLVEEQQRRLEQQESVWLAQQGVLLNQLRETGGVLTRASDAVERSDSSVRVATSAAQLATDLDRKVQADLVGLEASIDSLATARAEVVSNLDRIRQRVYGSWSFVVHERRVERLVPLPLTVSMDVISDDVLREFQVTLGGSVALPAQHVTLGETLCIASSTESAPSYQLTPSYVVELFFGDDIAGLQVEQLPDGESCTPTAP